MRDPDRLILVGALVGASAFVILATTPRRSTRRAAARLDASESRGLRDAVGAGRSGLHDGGSAEGPSLEALRRAAAGSEPGGDGSVPAVEPGEAAPRVVNDVLPALRPRGAFELERTYRNYVRRSVLDALAHLFPVPADAAFDVARLEYESLHMLAPIQATVRWRGDGVRYAASVDVGERRPPVIRRVSVASDDGSAAPRALKDSIAAVNALSFLRIADARPSGEDGIFEKYLVADGGGDAHFSEGLCRRAGAAAGGALAPRVCLAGRELAFADLNWADLAYFPKLAGR